MEPRPPGRLPRVLRAGAATTAVLGLAVAAHVEGGGSLPALPVLALLAALLLLVSAALTGRAPGPVRWVGLLGGGQLALHHLLGGLAGTSSCTPVELHRHHTVLSCGEAAAQVAHGSSTSMVLAHVLATLVSAALLRHGETVLTFLASWLRPLWETPRAAAVPVAVAPAGSGPGRPARPTAYLASPPLRGPPVALAA